MRVVETGLTTAAGTALGGRSACWEASPWPSPPGSRQGVNGAFGGYRQVYDWRRARGWLAFAADSTWGLLGTTLGNVLHLVNLAGRDSGYRADFSRRQNRHVFERGATIKRGFAVTHGPVISNASTGRGSLVEERRPFIDRHEGLHVWQNRIFGPIYQAVYVVWFAGGVVVGATAWALKREKPKMKQMVETAAYYDNPFEFWAYKHDGHWEDEQRRADPQVAPPPVAREEAGAGRRVARRRTPPPRHPRRRE